MSTGFRRCGTLLAWTVCAAVFRPQIASAKSHVRPLAASVCPQFIVAKSLVYPRPGSRHVRADGGIIIISGVSVNGMVTLSPRAGAALTAMTVTALPSPLPSPLGPAVSSGLIAFRLPALRRRETYTVFVRENAAMQAARRCPNDVPLEVGSFST